MYEHICAPSLALPVAAACCRPPSCSPNCYVQRGSGRIVVTATADVAAGTELCIAYIDLDLPRASRRTLLHRCGHGIGRRAADPVGPAVWLVATCLCRCMYARRLEARVWHCIAPRGRHRGTVVVHTGVSAVRRSFVAEGLPHTCSLGWVAGVFSRPAWSAKLRYSPPLTTLLTLCNTLAPAGTSASTVRAHAARRRQ